MNATALDGGLGDLVALVSIVLFAIGLKRLARVRTARSGNALLATGMLLAVVLTIAQTGVVGWPWILGGLGVGALGGVVIVLTARATRMPEIVARFNGFGGAASALVALALFWREVVEPGEATAAAALGLVPAGTLALSVVIGGATFSGSLLAELKLRGLLRDAGGVPARTAVMAVLGLGALALAGASLYVLEDPTWAVATVLGLAAVSALVGLLLVAPIGGADMPVVISLLNSLSGLAAAAAGFALGQVLLIIAGTMVGAAGLILTRIMCRSMNRSLLAVLAGGYGAVPAEDARDYQHVTSSDPEEAAMVLEAARSVVIVPGYGLAAGRAQHAAAELAGVLSARGASVRYAIHPVAGRMPGHMNVVLAEADVPYAQLVEMDQINPEFKTTDVAIVVGANDVVNPAAKEQPGSPIAGMPILEVEQAQRVLVIKRSLSPGYAGIKNELFERDNTVMLYGDAKGVLDQLTSELEGAPV